jgi:IclR family transcriptional regulator, KDG regulon repressor
MPVEQMQTLSRATALLDCFTYDRTELGVREAARLLGVSHSAAGRLMSAMKELGVLHQNQDTHLYSLGGKVLSWSGVYTSSLDVRNVALPAIQELHRSTQETISLYILEGIDRICVERLESPQTVRIVAHLGRRLPLYAGSAGKVFLAFLPPEKRDQILNETIFKPLTEKTIVDRTQLYDELSKIEERGYAVSHGEWILDASGVAAPVFNQSSEIQAALTISGPSQRFTAGTVEKYIREVVRVAQHISREMGYRPTSLISLKESFE